MTMTFFSEVALGEVTEDKDQYSKTLSCPLGPGNLAKTKGSFCQSGVCIFPEKWFEHADIPLP